MSKNTLLCIMLLFSFVIFAKGQENNQKKQGEIIVDSAPQYPGGDLKRINFMKKKLIYPKAARKSNIKGTVKVRFTIDSTGKILQETIAIEKGIHPYLDNEALKLIKQFPDWIPAYSDGKPVRCMMILPVRFGKVN